MNIDARSLAEKDLNALVRESADKEIIIENCFGERYIGSACRDKHIIITGTPGNALGAYLDGAGITVRGNVQDAVGDTMNNGSITVYGNAGDALGYAMRGGKIFIKGNSGYRTGIHMKQYREKFPIIVIGGSCGSFLGEYLAGGLIIVLGLGAEGCPTGNFVGTGMHGGGIWLRSAAAPHNLPAQVCCVQEEDISPVMSYLEEFSLLFAKDMQEILDKPFYRLTPNASNPYKRLYVAN